MSLFRLPVIVEEYHTILKPFEVETTKVAVEYPNFRVAKRALLHKMFNDKNSFVTGGTFKLQTGEYLKEIHL